METGGSLPKHRPKWATYFVGQKKGKVSHFDIQRQADASKYNPFCHN
ncbi:uncharacterized protein J3R85_010543 [Psidium guajava]|nr:uncharacterized protein J3R85_010543 [Psidium guajava]